MENGNGHENQAIEQVATNPQDPIAKVLSELPPKSPDALTIAAKHPGEVLPAKFYEGASTLSLNSDEMQLLSSFQDAPDEQIEIRPDGLIYASHIHYRRALTAIFGAEWALMPGSPVSEKAQGNASLIMQRWVLVVRGHYVGEAIGAGTYYESNPKQNKSDAVEGAQSEALRRICAKSALGIGSNVWDRKFAREWRRKHGKKVYVTNKGQNEVWWRRLDDDPFETERGDVPQTAAKTQPRQEEPPPAPKPEPATPKPQPALAPKPTPAPAPIIPTGTTVEAHTPPAATEAMVSDANFRLFMVDLRKRKLVVGDKAIDAIAWLCSTLNEVVPDMPGKTNIEVLHAIFMKQTRKRWETEILPKVRAYQAKE